MSVVDTGLAGWRDRAAAFGVDVLPGLATIVTLAVLGFGAELGSWLWWLLTGTAAVTFVAVAVNRVLVPWRWGTTLGRALFGLQVVRPDGGPVGLGRLLAREAAHLLDVATLFVGALWPLWDRRRRTFADLLAGTEVRRVPRPAWDAGRLATAVTAGAAAVCAAAVALSYLAVYRPGRAVDQAREQIAEQGPRIVEQLLTYHADTMSDDFARARSLATDAYRPQLVTQQQAVHNAGAISNEYWAVSSAVLSVAAERASMLLAMQGQRGANPQDLKFITATVRADFDKSPDGQWRVANLTVLKKPQLATVGQ